MTTHVPALPALVAARALHDDAARAARAALDQVTRLLRTYDLALEVLRDLPPPLQSGVAEALGRRLSSTETRARAAEARLDEARRLCRDAGAAPGPTAPVAVESPVFDMLAPYLDDAMQPVCARISARVGRGLTADDIAGFFPAPAAAA